MMGRGIAAGVGVGLVACAATGAVALGAVGSGSSATTSATRTVRVTVSGGHDTLAVDNGRPVALVAATLGVPATVFRKAFSGVTPAGAGEEPDPVQVGKNKAALLKVLAPYGVTNDELDRASNLYRYNGSAGQMWPTTAAVLDATVVGGRVTKVTVVKAGAGYTSAPTLTVPGVSSARLTATVAFGSVFATNGRVASVKVS